MSAVLATVAPLDIDVEEAQAAGAFQSARSAWPAPLAFLPTLLPKFGALGGLQLKLAAAQQQPPIGRMGSLEIRLARGSADIRRAQRLRYKVFYQEMSARGGALNAITRRDLDQFDALCDHLLVCDRQPGQRWAGDNVVGTYRLLRQEVAERHGGFYTDTEFRLSELVKRRPTATFLELGRSCVLPAYRARRTIELLWRGIYQYVKRHDVDVLIGCASFEGIDPDRLAIPLSYLHHYASAPDAWSVTAHPARYVEMNRVPKKAIDCTAALRAMPPLIRGYLRLGAFVGRGAVIDRRFGTTDVVVILPISRISQRTIQFLAPSAQCTAI